MKPFEVLAYVNPTRCRIELATVEPPLWDAFAVRSSYPGSAHGDTRSILLRGPSLVSRAAAPDEKRLLRHYLPHTRELVNEVLAGLPAAEVGNVIIAELKPFGTIDPHIDEGAYAEKYERIHICVDGHCVFYVDDQPHYPQPGDVFQFNHRRMHYVTNPFSESRTHIIVDLTLKE